MKVKIGIESGRRKWNDKATNLPTGPTPSQYESGKTTNLPTGPTLTADSQEKPASTTNLPTGPTTSRLHTKAGDLRTQETQA